jgi:hypothetical protein
MIGRTGTDMISRERWLAAIRFRPVDRLPFWPKLDPAYPRARKAPLNAMDVTAIHQWIGSDPHLWFPSISREVTHATRATRTVRGNVTTTCFEVNGRCVRGSLQFDEASQGFHPIRYPIQNLADLRLMIAYYSDLSVELDTAALEAVRQQIDVIGCEFVSGTEVGESPLMYFVEWLAGPEHAHYLLHDHPADAEELFAAMHRVLLRKVELAADYSPADILYLVEDTSTTLISPRQFRRYCFPHIQAYGAITRQAGRILMLHMCGYLKKLLPDMAPLPVEGFEAFTTPAVGDATLLDGRKACPDKCLVGGTNAALWLQPAGTIIAQLAHDLDALPHTRGLVITSGGVMPPACGAETIKEVGEWLKVYPIRV